ncbi:MAG: elongation factor P maturation arginine rhamnosyltransferase EarP [Burkholderiaceae bacterium]
MICSTLRRVTLACEVLDNFGDAGITWRLACQLADEWQADITIAIDLPELLTLWQENRERRRTQESESSPASQRIRIVKLDHPDATQSRPDLIIAMLGTTVPAAMRAQIREQKIGWIRYEYLTAEPWVDSFHGLRSIKPDDGMTEWFYYPGYTLASGGLLREKTLLDDLAPFTKPHSNASGETRHWLEARQLDSPAEHFRVCLFGYAEPDTQALIDALLAQPRPMSIFISESLAKGLSLDMTDARLRPHAWLDQPDFDRLLASCDLNLVRGEDSWLRAQWTGQPMFWQPYRQPEGGHIDKLNGYLNRLLASTDAPVANTLRQAMLAVNHGGDLASALPAWFSQREQIKTIHQQWRAQLAAQSSLSERLLQFCRDQLQLSL